MKYDEYELIEFFGVLPREQDAEEKEFFGSTIFDYHQDKYLLSVSYSIYHNDFILYLKEAGAEQCLVNLHLEGVEEITVSRDKPNSSSVLIIKARGDVEDNLEKLTQTIEIGLEPNVYIRMSNDYYRFVFNLPA